MKSAPVYEQVLWLGHRPDATPRLIRLCDPLDHQYI
jgi:hypothetical protein